jgi:hypothetical protein
MVIGNKTMHIREFTSEQAHEVNHVNALVKQYGLQVRKMETTTDVTRNHIQSLVKDIGRYKKQSLDPVYEAFVKSRVSLSHDFPTNRELRKVEEDAKAVRKDLTDLFNEGRIYLKDKFNIKIDWESL